MTRKVRITEDALKAHPELVGRIQVAGSTGADGGASVTPEPAVINPENSGASPPAAPSRRSRLRQRSPFWGWAATALVFGILVAGLALGVKLGTHTASRPTQPDTIGGSAPGSPAPPLSAQENPTDKLRQAAQMAADIRGQAAAVQTAARGVIALADPVSARRSDAVDPKPSLGHVKSLEDTLEQAVAQLRASITPQVAALGAQGFMADAEGAVTDSQALLAQADAMTQAWENVHLAPAGYLGVQVADPPSTWTVRGCEVQSVVAQSPASSTGLVGRTERVDPVGDVLYTLVNQSMHDQPFPLASCADFLQAMAQSRSGDHLVIQYHHRRVILLSGEWEDKQTFAVLAGTVQPVNQGCPAPVTGHIEQPGNRLRVSIGITGPKGSGAMSGFVDTGAGITSFSDDFLRGLGFKPIYPVAYPVLGAGSGASRGYLYRIPFPTLKSGDQWVPLGKGEMTVQGIAGAAFDFGVLLGPDALAHAPLQISGTQWSLTPPCS